MVFSDVHCVTGWSRLENLWEGLPSAAIKELVKILPGAGFAIMHAWGDFTTNFSLVDFFQADVILAVKHDGMEISPEHGYPVRLVVPRLYFWKSAKWIPAWSSHPRTDQASGRATATTIREIPGMKSAMDEHRMRVG